MRSILQMNVSLKAVLAIVAVAALVWAAATGFCPASHLQVPPLPTSAGQLPARAAADAESDPGDPEAIASADAADSTASKPRRVISRQRKKAKFKSPQFRSPTQRKQKLQTARQAQTPPRSKAPIQDHAARQALGLVGADPQAEQYWLAAINDFNLSGTERQDLIEDLNEAGFSDPSHPAAEDLPLIINRIELIEQVGPWAADKVNAEAFQEAYKDLVNMAEELLSR